MFLYFSDLYDFGLSASFVLCLVYELHKPPSSDIEGGTYQSSDICLCNLLFETDNFALGTVLLLYVVSKLQELPSTRLRLRTHYPEFWPF